MTSRSCVHLSRRDRADLSGQNGSSVRWAMEMVTAVAEAFGAPSLVDIEHAHLVGAYHSGPANLRLLGALVKSGARVRVPATLSASSADLTETAPACYQGLEQERARDVVNLGVSLGCSPALTCAPYFLDLPLRFGQRLAWAESNASIFANTVIGARSLKTPQFLDLACALTGRAPLIGPLTDEGRAPQLHIDASNLSPRWFETSIGPELLGYISGKVAGTAIPFVAGVRAPLDRLALRSICAGVGVTGGTAMLHIQDSTPEAAQWAGAMGTTAVTQLDNASFNAALGAFEIAPGEPIGAVFLGAPHYGPADLARLHAHLDRNTAVPLFVSISRSGDFDASMLNRLTEAGVTFVRDACTYYGAPVDHLSGAAVTTSVKWAAYAANRNIPVHLTSLDGALDAARTGSAPVSVAVAA